MGIWEAAVINSWGQLDGAVGTATDCVPVNGTSAAKANAVHTHAETDVTNLARGSTLFGSGYAGLGTTAAAAATRRRQTGPPSFPSDP